MELSPAEWLIVIGLTIGASTVLVVTLELFFPGIFLDRHHSNNRTKRVLRIIISTILVAAGAVFAVENPVYALVASHGWTEGVELFFVWTYAILSAAVTIALIVAASLSLRNKIIAAK